MQGLPAEKNFLGIPFEDSNPETARVVVLSVPFEVTSTGEKGSCEGPAAILHASRHMEFFDSALGYEPYKTCGGIATMPPMPVDGHDGPTLKVRLREMVQPWIDRGKFVIVIGAEHTSIVGAIEAHAKHYDDLTVLHLDAHSDLRPDYEGDPWNHACAMSRVLDFHDHIVQVGIRSQDAIDRVAINRHNIAVHYAHQIQRKYEEHIDWIGPIINGCKRRVYISLDSDVFDPAVIPATGTPEPGGLTWYQMDALLDRLIKEREVVGMDVTELAPLQGIPASQFTMARIIYRVIGYKFP
jgi:agmatinase